MVKYLIIQRHATPNKHPVRIRINDFLKRDFGYQGRKFNKITNDPQNIENMVKTIYNVVLNNLIV